jgi:hypothetical protein
VLHRAGARPGGRSSGRELNVTTLTSLESERHSRWRGAPIFRPESRFTAQDNPCVGVKASQTVDGRCFFKFIKEGRETASNLHPARAESLVEPSRNSKLPPRLETLLSSSTSSATWPSALAEFANLVQTNCSDCGKVLNANLIESFKGWWVNTARLASDRIRFSCRYRDPL